MYKIEIEEFMKIHRLIALRQANTRITEVHWFVTGFGLYVDGETYTKRTPILIWLN